ncbi:MAG: hypothetical protein GXC73_11930, partial [Chitinophagaceae bacterium]|nr:hypothetical protein [Chitinophagaceae bacterium]
MASLEETTRALEFYQDQMLENDNLSYLAIIQMKDSDGNPIDSYTIEAGVNNMQTEMQKRNNLGIADTKRYNRFVPSRLEIP